MNNLSINFDNLNQNIDNIRAIVKSINLTPENECVFWQALLNFLHSENNPKDQSKLPDDDSKFISYISNNCDMINHDTLSNIYKNIKNYTMEDPFWNESLQQLILYFINIKNKEIILPIGENDEHSITIQTLRDADAGNSFIKDEQYVKPWWNIDDKNYDEVRKHDEVIDILTDENKLQFTHNKISNWIRLLMPQYGRRVEIEDLDRNFWVIAQTISAISNYLFGDDNPFFQLISGGVREITELWENVLYLWLEAAMTGQNDNNKVRTIVMPIYPETYNYSYKYNDCSKNIGVVYDETAKKNILEYTTYNDEGILLPHKFDKKEVKIAFIKRFEFLTKQYNHQSLCIIPIVRGDNYYNNYYSVEYYPYVLLYHHTYTFNDFKDYPHWKVVRIKDASNKEVMISLNPKFDQENFGEKVYAMRQDELSYSYTFPYKLSNKDVPIYDEQIRLYGALRTRVTANTSIYNSDIEINDLTFNIYDANTNLIEHTDKLIGQYSINFENNQVNSFSYVDKTNSDRIEALKREYTDGDKRLVKTSYYNKNDESSVYYGEVASHFMSVYQEKARESLALDTEIETLKIGSFFIGDIEEYQYASSNGYYTSMRNNITAITKTNDNKARFYWYNWNAYKSEPNPENFEHIYEIPMESTVGVGNNRLVKGDFNSITAYKYGLSSVANYVKEMGIKKPMFFTTSCGLTPWLNSKNLTYWDVGGLLDVFLFIPDVKNFKEQVGAKDDDDVSEYNTLYNSIKTELNFTDITNIIGSDDIERGNNLELPKLYGESDGGGKVVYIGEINKLDTFYDQINFKNNTVIKSVYATNISRWRQFRLFSDEEQNYCYKIIYKNEDGEFSKFIIKINLDNFIGTLEYYDNRFRVNNNISWGTLKEKGTQVGFAPVQIDKNGYQQIGDSTGIIALPTTGINHLNIQSRTSIAKNDNNTGFLGNYAESNKFYEPYGKSSTYYAGYTDTSYSYTK